MAVRSILGVLALVASLAYSIRSNLCVNNEHVKGRWMPKRRAPSNKTFFCCTWEGDQFRKFPEVCGTDEWDDLTGNFYRANDEFLAHVGGHGCGCDSTLGSYSVSSREKYDWTPSTCHLLPWNARHFCHVLGNRTMLFIGDSTMQQSAGTVMALVTAGNGGCAHQLMFGRSDFLGFTYKKYKEARAYVKEHQADIVVMNVGAHFHDVGDMFSAWSKWQIHLKELRQLYGNRVKYAWKTQNPGHVDCTASQTPIEHFELGDSRKDVYQWNLYPTFDEISRNYSKLLDMAVVDMSPLYLRPDAHVYDYANRQGEADCLHYCLPGPVDLFAVLLYQMLHNNEL